MLLIVASAAANAQVVEDYPHDALKAGKQGIAYYKLWVAPDGVPYNCVVEHSAGFASLDEATCERMIRRARFRPITDSNGASLFIVYRGKFAWALAGKTPQPDARETDVVLPRSSLSTGQSTPFQTRLNIIVGADGTVEGCWPADPAQKDVITASACRQAAAKFRAEAARDQKGDAVRSQQNFTLSVQ